MGRGTPRTGATVPRAGSTFTLVPASDVPLRCVLSRPLLRGSPSSAPGHEHPQNVTASWKPQVPGAALCPPAPSLEATGTAWGIGPAAQLPSRRRDRCWLCSSGSLQRRWPPRSGTKGQGASAGQQAYPYHQEEAERSPLSSSGCVPVTEYLHTAARPSSAVTVRSSVDGEPLRVRWAAWGRTSVLPPTPRGRAGLCEPPGLRRRGRPHKTHSSQCSCELGIWEPLSISNPQRTPRR